MLVLDTDQVAPHERAAAFQDAISGHASTSLVNFEDEGEFRARVDFYALGAGRVFNVEATGNTLLRTPRIARRDEQNAIALALPLAGANRFRWGREESLIRADDLLLVDLEAPYEYGWTGRGTSYAFQVARDRLGLSMDTIARATTRLPSSPLYPLVRDHIRSLTTHAPRITDIDTAARVGDMTIELMHALLLTAGTDRDTVSMTSHVLVHQILTYVRQHLAEHDLTPGRIAAAHHISVRHLYKVCEENDLSLEAWIISHRLEAAKADLSSESGYRRTIGAIARTWGFSNPSHFAKRFRASYGMTPTEWRMNRTGGRPDGSARASR